MEKNPKNNITLEAKGSFPFTFFIEKAIATETDEDMIIEGVASTTNIDHDDERMSQEALRAMEAMINENGVPLRVEHQKDDNAIIGKVFKAWVDERNQLHIQARLDKSHPVSPILHNSMKSGVKMGLSVGGIVKRAVREFAESVGGMVKTFYDVALQEVSVTPRPANYDSWLIAKSIADDENDARNFDDNKVLCREFLLENSQLDYLGAFAKSVPNEAWKKININKDTKNMDEKDKEKQTEEETTKAVSRTEFASLSKAVKDLVTMVSKGFNGIDSVLSKALDSDAKDQVNPKSKKDESVDEAKKSTDGAEDQNNPDEKKPKDEDETAKAEDDEEEEETTKTSETDEEPKEKKTKTTKEKEDTYDLETVERSIKKFTDLRKRLKKASETDEEKEKAETEEEETKSQETEELYGEKEKADDEEETIKNIHPLDLFVATVTKTMEDVVDRMEKNGKRIMGFESDFLTKNIINNPAMQEEIHKMMRIPGVKKSVVMGVPYMVSKDGKRTALTIQAEKVEKSEQPKDFRSLYKSNYSSLSEQDSE